MADFRPAQFAHPSKAAEPCRTTHRMLPIANITADGGDLEFSCPAFPERPPVLSHNNLETADDSDLNALRAGGRDALAGIFQQMQPSLHRMLRLRLGRMSKREDESDVLQNTWLEAARRLDEYLADPRVSVTVWLRRITRQVFTRMWRTHMTTEMRSMDREQPLQKIAFDDSGDALATELSASMPSPASVIIQEEMKERLRELIADMPDSDREILALRHLESLSIRDAADELNIGLEAASKRYQRAIMKLSKAFGSPDR